MRSSRKTQKATLTPTNEGQKKEKETSTGKKLVQARLPFKIIAGTPASKPHDDTVLSSNETPEVPSKKRKLSFTEETENQKKIGKSDSKENLTRLEDVIVLDDDECSVSEPKTPTSSSAKTQKKKNKSTPNNANNDAKSTTPKLQIKLPLSGKKKRRKSKRNSQINCKQTDVSDSSDVELTSDDQINPQKKLKLEDLPKSEDKNESTDLEVVVVEKEKEFTKEKEKATSSPQPCPVTRNKRNSLKEIENAQGDEKSKIPKNTSKKLESESDLAITESKTPIKASKSTDSAVTQKLEKSSTKTENTKIVKQSEAETKISNSRNNSPKKASPSKRESAIETKRESRTTRKSISALESNKKITERDEVVSSEPELVTDSKTANSADSSLNTSNSATKQTKLLTPKQQKLMEQRRKAREEKELKLQQQKEERERKLQEQREERERKQQEEKLQKQKEREERELQKKKEREEKEEQKRREREEKEDQRRKEKEDKERKRLAELEAKNEEKRKKDEAKEEERRKKDEDRRRKELEKEEEENKKKKAKEAFTKFFVAKPAKSSPAEEDPESRDDAESVGSLAFRPFRVKGDMKLAPLLRREFLESSRERLDSFLKNTHNTEPSKTLYIDELKSGTHTPLKGCRTVVRDNLEGDGDDVILIASDLENAAQPIDEPRSMPIQTYRAKFFSFRENRRPPYYGTWRKKSTLIKPKRPFNTDKTFFDYEVDSDDEWEEEEPGESLNGSEDEKESEDDDYEVDNEWFVPHGHLSDEELQNEDELGPDTSREAQKAKLKALQQEFAQEMKKKTEKIKPRLIGTVWADENGNRPQQCPSIIWDSLCTRAMIFSEPILIEEPEVPEPEPGTPPPEKQKRIKIKDDLLKDLVRLVHGNRHSKVFIIKEYLEHVCHTCESIKSGEFIAPTKSQVKEKIDEIAEWSVVDAVNHKKKNRKKLCWVVSADVLDKHGLSDLGLRNEWSYKLQPKFTTDKPDQDVDKSAEEGTLKVENSNKSKTDKSDKKKEQPVGGGIAKFAKVLSKTETKVQDTSVQSCSSINSPKPIKKLVSPKVRQVSNSPKSAFKEPAVPQSTKTNKSPVVKKRVALLMSVAPGQEFSPKSKNALISNFLQKNKSKEEKTSPSKVSNKNLPTKMDVDEVIVLN